MSDKPEILITTASLHPPTVAKLDAAFTTHRLWQAADRRAFLASIADRVEGIATGLGGTVDAALIAALPRLRIIATSTVGLDAIDLGAARSRGIAVTNTPDVLTDCVADFALGLTIASARRICEADRFVRQGKWLAGGFPLATKLGGKTMGIVGMGRIGQAIATRAVAFGMEIAYHGPRAKSELPYRYYATLADLAAASHFLIVTAPGGTATRHMIDADILKSLGTKGTLINIARGSVVDEAALVAALQSGTIGGAALDVFADEPHVPEALFAMENVVLQPHLGSATEETRAAMGQLVVDNLKAFFAGEALLTPVG
ncbi:MAG: 2-hydroxyacid dehydrogenase [Rhodospirillales bacterium]|nr:2-hydroxyacid dehydrogenase [Rhodospirillales bacterium]